MPSARTRVVVTRRLPAPVEARMQELSRHEIDPPTAEDLRQLPLQLEDSETEPRPGLEID